MAKLTKRQRIHIRSFIQKSILVLGAAAVLVAIGLLIGNGIRKLIPEKPEPEPTATPMEENYVPATTAPPTAIEEPYADKPAVDTDAWNLRLVDFDHPLSPDFVPDLMEIELGEQFDRRAGMHLLKLVEDARAAGYSVITRSGYRSYDTQYFIYWNHVDDYEAQGMTREEAEAATRLAVNYPGCSEHQLGLAMDVLEFEDQEMEPYIGGSGLMLWLEEHCADYGFIIRYPDGKTDITGVEYEPWHLRYVGTCARYIMTHDLCLEEFLALYE